jgi:teichoic acid transport system permease protein
MKHKNGLPQTLREFYNQRNVFVTLVVRDFKTRYLSTLIGLPWAFIQPAVYIFVVWFAFTFGLRGGNTASGIPFAPWLIAGLIPWLFMSQTMIVSTASIMNYSYLIKKTNFNVSLIPIIKIFSGMIVHAILIGCFCILLIFAYGIHPSIYWLQIFYYLFALTVLLSGIGWFVASVNVFIRDMAHIVNILTTMLFWATPIIWPFSMLNGNYKYIALLNPFFYITEGYRYTFVDKKWFFEFTEMNIYFWTVTLLILFLGIFTFKKLRPDFGDEL